jgi:hypothetical protein
MKRNSYSTLAFAVVLALGLVASSLAVAANGIDCTAPVYTPTPNSAVITPYIFGDCPGSTFTPINNFPSLVSISDSDFECMGWTNLHIWDLSEDGLTPAVFENCSHYAFSAVFNGSGSCVNGAAEGGLRVSPWWSLNVDGRFNVRIGGNGEIACFGGRLPFYSFTSGWGVTYTPGTDIWMQIVYAPHELDETDPALSTAPNPATIIYKIFYQGVGYYSPPLPFDIGNPAEGHGAWGALYPAHVGGYIQAPNGSNGALWNYTAQWKNVQFEGEGATATHQPTWGQLKTLYR